MLISKYVNECESRLVENVSNPTEDLSRIFVFAANRGFSLFFCCYVECFLLIIGLIFFLNEFFPTFSFQNQDPDGTFFRKTALRRALGSHTV